MMKARTTPQRSHRPVAQQAICLPLLFACLAAPASGADAPDKSQLTVDRIFGPEQEFKTEDWGAAYWLKDSSAYTTLEVAERFKDSGIAKDAKSIKDIVRYAPESGQRDILVAAESLIPPGQPKPLPIEDYAWSDDAIKEGDNTRRHLFETLTRYLEANLPVTP